MKEHLSLAEIGDVLTPSDVQRVLGIGRNATYELIASGKLSSIRVTPRRIIVTRRALEALLGLGGRSIARSGHAVFPRSVLEHRCDIGIVT